MNKSCPTYEWVMSHILTGVDSCIITSLMAEIAREDKLDYNWPDGELQCVSACCNVFQRAAVCFSVLQCVSACCSVFQHVAVCFSVLQDVSACCSVFQRVAVCFSVLQCVSSVFQRVAACCGELRRVAVCCNVLQCVAVLQCIAVYCSVFQRVAVCCWVAVYCSVLQCPAVYCSVLQCVAVYCSVLQCAAVCCSILLPRSHAQLAVARRWLLFFFFQKRKCSLFRICKALLEYLFIPRGHTQPKLACQWCLFYCKKNQKYKSFCFLLFSIQSDALFCLNVVFQNIKGPPLFRIRQSQIGWHRVFWKELWTFWQTKFSFVENIKGSLLFRTPIADRMAQSNSERALNIHSGKTKNILLRT